MTHVSSSNSSHGTAESSSTNKPDDKKNKDTQSNQGGSSSDLEAAIQAAGAQIMTQIFQDQQERTAEDREDDADAA
ncbi:hypothetical protein [Robbsia andropogonis]|uniref:hypothetical protein n=1 Tax=Robbsia andropogonis TaxID=28092 RepID=UPI0012F93C46|nr:hypothetical protein [Robbsia andropogonis]MCP1118192.1 hypothetical protein [Robbsia andropogonis]MCP1127527.1 hypothetical protein [Robbsia andropogonis]